MAGYTTVTGRRPFYDHGTYDNDLKATVPAKSRDTTNRQTITFTGTTMDN